MIMTSWDSSKYAERYVSEKLKNLERLVIQNQNHKLKKSQIIFLHKETSV